MAGLRVYWTSGSIPELADLPRSERGRVLRRCALRGFRHWQIWAALVFTFVLMAVGIGVSRAVGNSPLGLIIGMTIGGLGGLVFGQVHVFVVRPYLREARRG